MSIKKNTIKKYLQATSYKLQANQSAVAALLVIIIISAAALIMAYSASILGLGELDMGYTSQKGTESFSVADGCMEEVLRRIRLNTDYGVGEGEISLTVSNGSCIIQVSDLGGNQRRVSVVGKINNEYYKKIQVDLTLTGNVITIDTWEERTD